MKFRTDFVTNSSSSSFIAWTIKNKRLAKLFEECGFESTDDTVHDILKIILKKLMKNDEKALFSCRERADFEAQVLKHFLSELTEDDVFSFIYSI